MIPLQGRLFAKFESQGNHWFNKAPVVDRLGVKFPSDPEYLTYSTHTDGFHYRVNSIFDLIIPSSRKLLKAKKVVRNKTYSTKEGKVVIKAVGYDQE